MERADHRLAAVPFLLGDDARGAVPAQVVEGTHHAVLAAHHHGALVGNLEALVISAVRDIRNMGNEHPVAQKDLLQFELGQFVVVISPGRQPAAGAGYLEYFFGA